MGFLARALNISIQDISGFILGGHADTMVTLLRYVNVNGIPLNELVEKNMISRKKVTEIIERTKKGGDEIIQLLQTSSAYYAPASSAIEMAESYLLNQRKVLPCSTLMQGEYGLSNICIGAPVIIGQNGIEEIIELPLSNTEKA